MSDSSGGAISIHCRPSYGIVHECTFVRCQTKAQGACIYFSGSTLESFRCCCINCSARYNAMFSSSQHTVQSDIGKHTTIDMLSVFSSTSQTNAVSTQNGDTRITNINLTKSRSTGTILAIEFTDIPHGEISYFTFNDNKGDTRDSSIIYVLDDISETSKIIHHGNFIKNTCANGGYLFNFIALGTVSDCIFKDNARATLFAIRYCVTFISCVFDGAESKTDFQTFKSCQFLTETSTMEFTMMDCDASIFNHQKLNLYLADDKNNFIVHFNAFGYVTIFLGIVVLLSVIIYTVKIINDYY